jgi:hypothetical protein
MENNIMKEYRVMWETDVVAATPMEAARMAYGIQRDPNSIATVFVVKDEYGTGEAFEADVGHGYCIKKIQRS